MRIIGNRDCADPGRPPKHPRERTYVSTDIRSATALRRRYQTSRGCSQHTPKCHPQTQEVCESSPERPFRHEHMLLCNVKLGRFSLDSIGKIGYCKSMLTSVLYFALKLSLIVTLWLFVWHYMEPRTQAMRILRAALLVLGLLGVLAVVRITGG